MTYILIYAAVAVIAAALLSVTLILVDDGFDTLKVVAAAALWPALLGVGLGAALADIYVWFRRRYLSRPSMYFHR